MADTNQTTSGGSAASGSTSTQSGSTATSGGTQNSGSNSSSTTTSGGNASSGNGSSSSGSTSGGTQSTPASSDSSSGTSSDNKNTAGGSSSSGNSSSSNTTPSSGGSTSSGSNATSGSTAGGSSNQGTNTATSGGNSNSSGSGNTSSTTPVVNGGTVTPLSATQISDNQNPVLDTSVDQRDYQQNQSAAVALPVNDYANGFSVNQGEDFDVALVTSGTTDVSFFSLKVSQPSQGFIGVDPISGNIRGNISGPADTAAPIPFTLSWVVRKAGNVKVTGQVSGEITVKADHNQQGVVDTHYVAIPSNGTTYVVDESMNATVVNSFNAVNLQDKDTVGQTLGLFIEQLCRYPSDAALVLTSNTFAKVDAPTLAGYVAAVKAARGADTAHQLDVLASTLYGVYSNGLKNSQIDYCEIIRSTRSQRIVGFIQQQARLNTR